MVELKGLHRVKSGGHAYVYAWRGGPRLFAKPGTPEFMAEYNQAVELRKTPDTSRFSALVYQYRASDDFKNLAPTTRRIWARWLDLVGEHFGPLSIQQFDRPEKIRPLIRKWRASYADKPRTADYAMQVLSRVLSYAVDPLAKIASNPCEGIKTLYSNDRSSIIWTDEDLAQLRLAASEEVMWAVDLAAATGLRTADLFRLAWSHVGKDAIVIATSKSRHKVEAVVPLYDELRALLKRIPRRSTIILTNKRSLPWGTGYHNSFGKAYEGAKLTGKDLHFHDLRGTAATRLYLAGFEMRVIAEVLGWTEGDVEKIIRRYVGRNAAVQDAIARMRARSGTKAVKTAVKSPVDDDSK